MKAVGGMFMKGSNLAFVIAAALWAPGCSCGGPGEQAPTGDDGIVDDCSDVDGDGYGVGTTCDGPDCDDSNPKLWEQAACEAACEANPHSTGCECDHAGNPEPEICYAGDPAILGIGPCRSGFRICTEENVWTECQGQVLPDTESCDGVDNDCDGQVDEGVTNECGTCAAECHRDCVGGDAECGGFDVENEGDGVEACEGDPGCITLGQRNISLNVIWIANTAEGTVSKVDTRTDRKSVV